MKRSSRSRPATATNSTLPAARSGTSSRWRALGALCALASGALGAGCATEPSRQTTVDLTRAQTLIEQAEQGGAQQYAPENLQAARDRLHEAEQLSNSGKQRDAERAATEAGLDAQLAVARASAGKQARAAEELSASLNTLRGAAQPVPAPALPAAEPAPAPPGAPVPPATQPQ